MKTRKTYPVEFRSEAVKLVLEQGLSLEGAARRLGIPKGTLANWVVAARSGGDQPAPGARSVTELEAENAKLRKELAEARLERDVIKKAGSVLCSGITARYAWIEEHRNLFPVVVACRVLAVSRAGYYGWRGRSPSEREQEDERLKVAIRAAHAKTRETYGVRRLQPELAAMGFEAGRDRIDRLRRQIGIRCRQKRKFKATTNSAHSLPVAENVLGQVFEPPRPNQVWTGDITYIPTDEGWLYLAALKDVFSCEIVGYAMGARMTTELVSKALFRAVQHQRPPAGLIHHTDRGSQYCAKAYGDLLTQFRMHSSMSRKGNCFDNAPIESFWGTLKNELVHHRRYATRAEAEASIREYIEIFYNRQRRHSRLGYLAPAEFTRKYWNSAKAA
ncbi:IS3 family transposase [Pseudogulbenkiania sp. MAI-1]|uniref:IS3 family transposase n=1 Tax=Pseudogulbenkiania sp. MAI-1 TaxID=990370 RepID=UPI0012EC1D7F|nr:IS3 family transposase [Pseudogulbenkiania sp. MAI-1]